MAISTTHELASVFVERVGDEAGEDSESIHMRRIEARLAECEDTTTSDAVDEAREKHLDQLTKVDDTISGRATKPRNNQASHMTMGGQ